MDFQTRGLIGLFQMKKINPRASFQCSDRQRARGGATKSSKVSRRRGGGGINFSQHPDRHLCPGASSISEQALHRQRGGRLCGLRSHAAARHIHLLEWHPADSLRSEEVRRLGRDLVADYLAKSCSGWQG